MITITVRVCGDFWANPEEVQHELAVVAGKDCVVLDLQAEGPSLAALGITDVIDSYCREYCVNPADIFVNNWSNAAEPVPYTVMNLHLKSHFFEFSKLYWPSTTTLSTHQHVFGYFIGRRAIPRAVIMYQLYHLYNSRLLFSCLQNKSDTPWYGMGSGINLEHLSDWLPTNQHKDFCNWWDTDPIASLDNHLLVDQFDNNCNTNRDILSFYNQFDIELVAESYTRGQTFFPTEKTVRPITSAKPFIIYGPRNFLLGLRKLGFDTYCTLWDESYDLLEGPPRWHAIQKLIDHIMNLPSDGYSKLFEKAQIIANQNRQHLAHMIGIKQ
jgi:hypothetical protein